MVGLPAVRCDGRRHAVHVGPEQHHLQSGPLYVRHRSEHTGDADHPDLRWNQGFQHSADAGPLPELRRFDNHCNTDYGTDIAGALTSLNSIMPTPGLGSNSSGDTPQEVVFLVTDGVEDKIVASCPNATFASNSRCQQPLDTTMCTTIKNRGIKIAILYTEYLQLKSPKSNITDSWYMSWVDPYDEPTSSTGTIARNLQACASPGFFSDVQTGGDISTALTNLFIKVASSTASLTQ